MQNKGRNLDYMLASVIEIHLTDLFDVLDASGWRLLLGKLISRVKRSGNRIRGKYRKRPTMYTETVETPKYLLPFPSVEVDL